MKFSRFYAPTIKEEPKDATLPSHKLLIRAGFIAQSGAGLYNYLPLGVKMIEKVKVVIREEMEKISANEVDLSFVTPAEFWKNSGRYYKFGKELLRFHDRKNNEFVLSPTNEESMVDLVTGKLTSYKQLPKHLYQIGLKFRDEARPRFGLMRGREFLMQDGYSFHASKEDLVREFNEVKQAYSNVFARLGFDFRIVDADSGAIGGSGSKEFMVLADNGEDDIVISDKGYAANIEVAKRAKRTCDDERPEANKMTKFKTENISQISDLADFFHINPFYIIKAVVKKAIFEDEEKIVVFFIRGDDELQEQKALNACKALELEDASEEEMLKANLVPGFIGPAGLPNETEFFIDNELKDETQMIIGANEKDYHIIGFNVVNFIEDRFADLAAVRDGDKALDGGTLKITKGIEVGHIFQLGQRYAEAMNATFLDENGKSQVFWMGCYGIGVSRLVAAMVEASHDEKGCIWKKTFTPFDAQIIISNIKDEEQVKFGEELYSELQKEGFDILLDDRNERFGPKISDFELIGVPYGVLIGKSLKDGFVELIERKSLEKTKIKKEDLLRVLKENLC